MSVCSDMLWFVVQIVPHLVDDEPDGADGPAQALSAQPTWLTAVSVSIAMIAWDSGLRVLIITATAGPFSAS